MAWTEEQKAQVIKQYTDKNPTPETSTEIIKEIAETSDPKQTVNGIRMVLSQAQVYVKKDDGAAKGTTATGEAVTATKRVSKDDSINALKAAIAAKGKPVDDEILSKLTGKAAIYLTSVIS